MRFCLSGFFKEHRELGGESRAGDRGVGTEGEDEDVALFQQDFIYKLRRLTHGSLLVSICGKGEWAWGVLVCMHVRKHTCPSVCL